MLIGVPGAALGAAQAQAPAGDEAGLAARVAVMPPICRMLNRVADGKMGLSVA